MSLSETLSRCDTTAFVTAIAVVSHSSPTLREKPGCQCAYCDCKRRQREKGK